MGDKCPQLSSWGESLYIDHTINYTLTPTQFVSPLALKPGLELANCQIPALSTPLAI